MTVRQPTTGCFSPNRPFPFTVGPLPCRVFLGIFMLVAWSAVARAAEPLVVKENGGWCWFQGERAVVVEGKVMFTTIASGDRGEWNSGDLVATSFEPKSNEVEHFVLHPSFQSDDHDVAGLCVLPDKRVLAVYGKHGNDHLQRWRISGRGGDLSKWTEEASVEVGAGYTYANVYRLSNESNRIFNFHRGRGFNPNCWVSDDLGSSWRYGWRLVEWPRSLIKGDPKHTGLDGGRPYVRYDSDGEDTIHFIMTDDHPRAYDNSIYHGYYRGGKLYKSGGEFLVSPSNDGNSTLKPNSFTKVFAGKKDRVAWTSDIRIDKSGHPHIAFSVQVDGGPVRSKRAAGGMDHRYYYGRWDGTKWQVHPMAYAGTRLYAGEDDYTGLVTLDPQDPSVAVISTNADPKSGKPLISSADGERHWELYRGVTRDGGKTWQWTALTANSASDQLRPVIPDWSGGPRVILWARGKLRSYTNYQLDIVAIVQER